MSLDFKGGVALGEVRGDYKYFLGICSRFGVYCMVNYIVLMRGDFESLCNRDLNDR